MDRGKIVELLKANKKTLEGLGKVVGTCAVIVALFYVAPYATKKTRAYLDSPDAENTRRFVSGARSVFDEMTTKIETLSKAEQDAERLKLENASLRLQIENGIFECRANDAAARSNTLALKLNKETGAKVGRALASINYRPPMHLLPPQLYTLAISYFKGREDEKAAIILTFLTGLEDNSAYKTTKNFLVTGVAWYRLANYDLADAYFERALQNKDTGGDNLPYLAQARLWRALVSEKTGKHLKSQFWLTELVDNHPQSTEALWVNSAEGKRVPAAQETAEE